MRYGRGWYDTDAEALRLAMEVFSAALSPLREPGALANRGRRLPEEKPLEGLPSRTLRDSSPKETFPKERGSQAPAGASSIPVM